VVVTNPEDRSRMMRHFIPCFLRPAATLAVPGITTAAARVALPDADVSKAPDSRISSGNERIARGVLSLSFPCCYARQQGSTAIAA
jgi:hypothetical protein